MEEWTVRIQQGTLSENHGLDRTMDMQSVDLVAGLQYRFSPRAQALDLDSAKFTEIQVDVSVAKVGGNFVLLLSASAQARLVCDRTLDEFSSRLSGTCRILLQWRGEPVDDEGAYDELLMIDPLQRHIDITEVARDTLMLAIPARKIAPHAEELQLPHVFGAPADGFATYWAPLRHLNTNN